MSLCEQLRGEKENVEFGVVAGTLENGEAELCYEPRSSEDKMSDNLFICLYA
jgi:hypothetical protein